MGRYFLFTAVVTAYLSYRVSNGHIMRRNMRIFIIPGILFLVSSYMIFEEQRISTRALFAILLLDFILGILGGIILVKATRLRVLENGQIYKDGGSRITVIFIMYLVMVVLLGDFVIGNDGSIDIKIASFIMTLGVQFLLRDFIMALKLDEIYGMD